MTQETYDNKIRIVPTHQQGSGSIEFCIPKELCERYDLTKPGHLMILPKEDSFVVRKLLMPSPEDFNK